MNSSKLTCSIKHLFLILTTLFCFATTSCSSKKDEITTEKQSSPAPAQKKESTEEEPPTPVETPTPIPSPPITENPSPVKPTPENPPPALPTHPSPPPITSPISEKPRGYVERNRIFCENTTGYINVLNSLSEENDASHGLFFDANSDGRSGFLNVTTALPYLSDGEKVNLLFSASFNSFDHASFLPLYFGIADLFNRKNTFQPIGVNYNPSIGTQLFFERLGIDWRSYAVDTENNLLLYAQLKPKEDTTHKIETNFILTQLSSPQKKLASIELSASQFINPRINTVNKTIIFDEIKAKDGKIVQTLIQLDSNFNILRQINIPSDSTQDEEWQNKAHQLFAQFIDTQNIIWIESHNKNIKVRIGDPLNPSSIQSFSLPTLPQKNFYFPQFAITQTTPHLTLAFLNYENLDFYEIKNAQLKLKSSHPLPSEVKDAIKSSLEGGFTGVKLPQALHYSKKFNELYMILPTQYFHNPFKFSLNKKEISRLSTDSCEKISFVYERFKH